MSQVYEIVFYGKLVEGFSEETTKQHVAQLFKTSIEQVERMFTGKRVVIRNKLDAQTAQKYIAAMEKRGARCQIEQMGAPGQAVDLSAPSAEVSPVAAPVAENNSASTKPATTETNATAVTSAPVSPSASATQEVASKSGLNLAGDKADEILATIHLDLDPLGIRLSEEHEESAPDLPGIAALSLAPVGVDLADEKDDTPVAVPDTSHLSLE